MSATLVCLSPPRRRAARAEQAVRDWLETQSRVTAYWRDLLLSSDADPDLIEALEEHAAFLAGAARR